MNISSGSSIDSIDIDNVRKLGFRVSASAALLERSASIDELADILKRRNIRTIYYFHADHYEPWSLGLNERTATGVERFGEMSLASPFARRMSLFYSAYVPYNLDVTENQRAVGHRVAGDSVYFHSRTDKQEELARNTIRPLFEPGAHELHLHVHHEFWTRNESHFDTAVSKWVNANSTAAMDRERLDLFFTLCREVISRELGRPFDRWAFVHGNWSLAASDPLICTIENELGMIMRHGGFGDFSFPAGRAYCDPKLQLPFTCRPIDGKRPYDDPASDPLPLAAGSGVLSSDRFFIWNSPIKAQYSSLDYYSEPNRELFKQSARILSEWLGNSVAFGPDLYIKTHAHSMKWEYEVFKPDSQIPHLYPDVINIFEELLRVCDKAGVEFRLATVNEVMANLEALDTGRTVDATSIKPTFGPTSEVGFGASDAAAQVPGPKPPPGQGRSITSAGSPAGPNDEGALDSLAASESYIAEKLRAWVHADEQRLEEAGSFYLKLLDGEQVLQDYERAVLDYLLANVPPDKTTVLEVGVGYGVLSILLAKAGYHVIACEGSRGRLDGFKFLVESLNRHVPGIADRVTAVQGWFPDAFDPAVLPVGRRAVLLTTNIVALESAERQADILETARLFDDFIVDTTRFGIPRFDEDEAGEVYEAISQDWRLVARVWRCKPNQIWHFESQKSAAVIAMTQKQLEGELPPVGLVSFNEELLELQRRWLAGEGKTFAGDDFYASKIARGASLETYETAVASSIVKDFERESTSVVEVGSGYGALALLLGRHGFAVQSFEGDRRRTAAAAWLYGQYSERYPGLANRIRFVPGFFPEVSQLEAASSGVRRLCVATNVTCTYTAKNQDLILDHFGTCDELILDLGRFGVVRNSQAERDTLRSSIEDRGLEAVDRVYFAAPYEYWRFRKKKVSDGLVSRKAGSPTTSELDTHSFFPVRDRHGVLYSVFGDKRLPQCPVCGATSKREIWRIPMSSVKEPASALGNYYSQFPTLQVPADIYCFDFCGGCQSVYLNPVDGNRKQNFRRNAQHIDSMQGDGAWQGYEQVFDRFAKWLPENASVMVDAACGIGQYLEVARRRMPDRWQKLIGLELSENYVRHMRDCKLDAHVLDLDTEPFDDIVAPGSVDVVFFCDAFQHVERPMLVLRKLLNTLRPGGRLFFTAQRYGRDVQAAVRPGEPIYVGEAFLEQLPRGARLPDCRHRNHDDALLYSFGKVGVVPMCGMAGALLKKAGDLTAVELRRRGMAMTTILHHRGPDGFGVWADSHSVLAHTRLAIIDTTNAAAQPMHDETDTVHIVFNGEIYNFMSLRTRLQAAGYAFRNRSDTEVLVNGYREWGLDLFAKLVGMFAIAIWDSRRKRLVLARDRFGEKPLYYADRPDAFVFGSEIKALLTWPGMPRRPDMGSIHDYLSFGFSMAPGTSFEGIGRLQPAHLLVYEAGKGPRITRYWEMPSPDCGAVSGSTEDLKHELIDRLRDSVKSCLVSDVPLGAFLSGGVDSSAVVALMSDNHGAGIKTFSSGFGFGDYDETRFATMVADRYNTDHKVFTFDSNLLASMGDLAWYYGEPFADSSALVTYALSRETRRSVTVALTGDGADETLLGYARYFNYGDMRRSKPPRGARRLDELYLPAPRGEGDKVAATDAYGFMLERFREGQKLAGYGIAMLPHLGHCSYERLLPYFKDLMPEETAARFDQSTYLPDDLLVKVDIAAMAHGLETRAPFLNHELAEWVATLPPERKIWDREGKALLKSALEPLLPHECMYRTKVGFRVPVAKFMNEEIRDQTDEILLGDRFLDRGIMREDFVRQMLNEHRGRRADHGTRLWTLVCLEMWFRTWIDSDSNSRLAEADDPFAGFTWSEPPMSAPNSLVDSAPALLA